MKIYDFDKVVERRGSGAIKTDALGKVFGKEDLIPMWVADMDFETPDFIIDALNERMQHPIFGYTAEPEDYRPAICDWIQDHHGWEIRKEWLSYIPGIVKGIGMAINALLKEDEKVIIQPPVYHPFRLVPQKNNREVVFNPLRELPDGGYEMDFENLEAVCDDKCRMLILSNPHNPAGVIWPREALERLAAFCYSRGIIVISDEIHCDMALFGNKHIPFASVSPEAAACSITFGAPSKTFNIAGIVSSYSIVPDETLRERFYKWMEANEMHSAPIFSPIATIAAFRKGEEWRRQMVKYVEGNVDLVISYCAKYIPQIKPLRPQASFLVWLDCRGLGLDHDALTDLFINKAGLALNDGETFNPGGEGFMRLNIGTSRATLKLALDRLAAILSPGIEIPTKNENYKKYNDMSSYNANNGRKFYRDADGKKLAGVCSGLAIYFDIDVLLIRLLFLVAFFFCSAGFWIYIILWIMAPIAKTPLEKCELRGLPPTEENLKKF